MLPKEKEMAQEMGVSETPKGCRQRQMNFPKRVFQSLGVTFSPRPLGWAAGRCTCRTKLDAGERTLWEFIQKYSKSHMCGFK